MSTKTTALITQWLNATPDQQKTAVATFAPTATTEDWHTLFNHAVSQIKEKLQGNGREADQIADLLLLLSTHSPIPDHPPLAARMKAQVLLICFGQHDQAKQYYDQALSGYQASGNDLERAKTENTHIWLLALTDHAEEAFQRGKWAKETFVQAEAWDDHTVACNNLAIVYHLHGHVHNALQTLGDINTAYLNETNQYKLIGIEANRALFMQELGQYNDAIQLIQQTIPLAQAQEESNLSVVGNLKHNLALAYIKLGNYTAALPLLDEAAALWEQDERYQDVALSKLVISECHYQLRRFTDVIDTFTDLRQLMTQHNVMPEKQFAFVNEARAYMALNKPEDALHALQQAQTLLNSENLYVLRHFELVGAEILHHQQRWVESMAQATTVAEQFIAQDHQFAAATGYLLAAQNALALNDYTQGHKLVDQAAQIATTHDLPSLRYKIEGLRGQLHQPNHPAQALQAFEVAIGQLERLQSHIMVEFRPSFMQDTQKQQLYEQTAALLLEQGKTTTAWRYVERAKSRALLDLLGGKVNLHVRPQTPADQPLVSQLNQLRRRRNELSQQVSDPEETEDKTAALTEANSVEEQITDLWHKLLLRNAAYGRSAALNHIQTEIPLPQIDPDTAVVEYFPINGRLHAFILTIGSATNETAVQQIPLNHTLDQITALYRHLFLNIGLVARAPQANNPAVLRNMKGVLGRLYQALLQPLAPILNEYPRWRIVPHGILHYLPFEAFHDGSNYIVEQTAVSYLPSVSTAAYSQPKKDGSASNRATLVVGHSYHGRLPQTQAESTQLAQLCNGELYQESAVTSGRLTSAMRDKTVIHIATHGEFRADNPLFSGLFLEDGWLTPLDIFELELSASLVTLSACHTGRSVISGGDELLGITRAFLTAGASSLLLTQWAVEDRSTALLMAEFYRHLLAGQPKDVALQQAQLGLLHGRLTPQQDPTTYQHPFFWSPFFLTGHNGRL